MAARGERGFTLLEMLVSLSVLLLVLAGLAQMVIENSRINRDQQMTAQVHANARNCMLLLQQKLRSAGWDPLNAGIATVALDPDLSDDVSEIEVFADIDEDGLTDGTDEQLLIRHDAGRISWRRTNEPSDPFVVVATNISNDADGDGTVEPLFVPDSFADPTRITLQITARSPVPSPMTGEFIRYTVTSDVTLRKDL